MGTEVEDEKRLEKFTALLRQDQLEALGRFASELKRSKTFLIREAVDRWIERRRSRRDEG